MSKLKYEDIKNEIVSCGWKINSTEYKNLKTELEMICPNEHIINLSLEKWRKRHECPICSHDVNLLAQTTEIKILPKVKGKKRVLAIDDATEKTGWSIFDGTKLVAYGKKVATSDKNAIKRITEMRAWLINMINNWKPDFIAVEDIQLQNFLNPRTKRMEPAVNIYKVLAQLQGALLVTLEEQKIDYTTVPAVTWKSYCKIKGKAREEQKRNTQLKVTELYKEHVSQDEADAICIGKYTVESFLRNYNIINFEELT